jgi:hypothetical protein
MVSIDGLKANPPAPTFTVQVIGHDVAVQTFPQQLPLQQSPLLLHVWPVAPQTHWFEVLQ